MANNNNKNNKKKDVKPEGVTFITSKPNMRVGKYRFRGHFLTVTDKKAINFLKNMDVYGSWFWEANELKKILIEGRKKGISINDELEKELMRYFLALGEKWGEEEKEE